MYELWLITRYLVERAQCRASAALRGDPESGALSLEWIVIAVLLVAAATAASVLLTNAINNEAKKLP